ncbi:MAG: alkaline phosphatase family protein [Acholeplasmataceae bacterium]
MTLKITSKRLIFFLKIILFSVLAVVSIFKFSYANSEIVTVTLTSILDNNNVIGPIEHQVTKHSIININDFNDNDYDFSFWLVNGVVRTDLNSTSSFFAYDGLNLTVVYQPTNSDSHPVIFIDTNGHIIDDVIFIDTGNSVNAPILLKEYSKPGLKLLVDSNKKPIWTPLTGNKTLNEITKPTVFSLTYDVADNIDPVMINNQQHNYNKLVTLSNENPNFSYWEEDGVILSYQEDFILSALYNRNITEVNDAGISKNTLVTISQNLNLRENYDTFLGHFEIHNENETLINIGFIASEVFVNNLTFETPNAIKIPSNNYNLNSNEFLRSIPKNMFISYRAYLETNKGIYYSETIAPRLNDSLMIYEIYGNGGLSESLFNQNYVVLYNGSNLSYDLNNYSLHFAHDDENFSLNSINLSGIISPNEFFLIELKGGGLDNNNHLPAKISYSNQSLDINSNSGTLALALDNSELSLTGLDDSRIIDLVGIGNSNMFEGENSADGTLLKNKSLKRSSMIDSNNNDNDFFISEIDLSYLPDRESALITFNSNGGTNIPTESVYLGLKIIEPEIPLKDGYEFIHWYLEDENIPFDFNTKIDNDITLNAKWELLTVVEMYVTIPDKLNYFIDEAFDTKGLAVDVLYSNNIYETLNSNEYDVSGFNSDTIGTKTITVSFMNKTFTFTVLVEDIYVVYINIDGFPKYYYDEGIIRGKVPNLSSYIGDGLFFDNLETLLPSVTTPLQYLILGGFNSHEAQNAYRYYDTNTDTVIQQGREIARETLYDVIKEKGISSATIRHFPAEGIFTTNNLNHLYVNEPSGSNPTSDVRFNQAVNLVKGINFQNGSNTMRVSEIPRFLSVYVDDLDAIGHNQANYYNYSQATSETGRMNNVMNKLGEIDAQIKLLVDAYKDRGIYHKTVFFVTTDHGMTPFGAEKNAGIFGSNDKYHKTKWPALRDKLKQINSEYIFEYLGPGESPKSTTTVVGVGAGLNMYLTFKGQRIRPNDLETIKNILLQEEYVEAVLTKAELNQMGYWRQANVDMLVVPSERYHFHNRDNSNGGMNPRGQHDSYHETSRHIFGMVFGGPVEKIGHYSDLSYVNSFGVMMAEALNLNLDQASAPNIPYLAHKIEN